MEVRRRLKAMGLVAEKGRRRAGASKQQPQPSSAEFVDSDSDGGGRGREGKRRYQSAEFVEDSSDSGGEEGAGHRDGEMTPPNKKPQRKDPGTCKADHTHTEHTQTHTNFYTVHSKASGLVRRLCASGSAHQLAWLEAYLSDEARDRAMDGGRREGGRGGGSVLMMFCASCRRVGGNVCGSRE